jgi:hypothetical protein
MGLYRGILLLDVVNTTYIFIVRRESFLVMLYFPFIVI